MNDSNALDPDEFHRKTQTQNKPKVYLAGPIQHADDGGHGWRDRVINNHQNFQYLNPLDFFDGGEDKATILPEDVAEDYETDKEEFVITDEELVEKDKRMVHEADALLIGFPEKVPAWGTPMEQAEVWNTNDSGGAYPSKPVVVWHGEIDEVNLSPWIRYHDTFRSNSLAECVEYIEAVTGAVPLCVSCRVEAGVSVDGTPFTAEDRICVKCENHTAMRVMYQ